MMAKLGLPEGQLALLSWGYAKQLSPEDGVRGEASECGGGAGWGESTDCSEALDERLWGQPEPDPGLKSRATDGSIPGQMV